MKTYSIDNHIWLQIDGLGQLCAHIRTKFVFKLTYVVCVFFPFFPIQFQSAQQPHKHEVKSFAPEQPLQFMISVQQLQPFISGFIVDFTQILRLYEPKFSHSGKVLTHNRRRQHTPMPKLGFLDTLARSPQNLDYSVEFASVLALSRTVAPLYRFPITYSHVAYPWRT